jgi:protein phosphatase 1 regulatory subunit 3A/B/C/D/E
LGFGLSEPNILEIKKLQRLNYKEKIHHAKSSASIAKTGLNEPAIYGSLPAASRLAKITKDLESKRVPVKSFNIESKKKTVSSARTTKKIVRFADSFGFDLEKVQFIGKNSFSEIFSPSTQNIPNIEEEDSDKINENKPFMVLLPLFSLQKSTQVTDIKLESYVYDYENKMIRCMVKVHNISFHKRVFARITLNQWKSYYDLNAVYVKSESQKTKNTWNDSYQNVSFDFFGFCLIIPDKSNTSYKNPQEKSLVDDSTIRIEFALGFETDNQSHWDNNFGQNYKFQLFYNI